MGGQVAFPLSDKRILRIYISQQDGREDLNWFADGKMLFGFQVLLEDGISKRNFSKEIVLYPFPKRQSFRRVTLEVQTSNHYGSSDSGWLGKSFSLACVIAFARSQGDKDLNDWPSVIATATMERVNHHRLLIGPVESFTEKLKGVLDCPIPPDYFIFSSNQYPKDHDGRSLIANEDRELLAAISENGTSVITANSLWELSEVEDGILFPYERTHAAPDEVDLNSREAHQYSGKASSEREQRGDEKVRNYKRLNGRQSSMDTRPSSPPGVGNRGSSIAAAGDTGRAKHTEKRSNEVSVISKVGASLLLVLALISLAPLLIEVFSQTTMVTIRGGTFEMGCNTDELDHCKSFELPVRTVSVPDFKIAKREVTVREYDIFVKATGHNKPKLLKVDENAEVRNIDFDILPVVNVSWHDAKAYITWLNREEGNCFRLPTEAEWEYVARGGTDTSWYTGVTINENDKQQANISPGAARVLPVGSSKDDKHPFGLFDIHGNVWEWVEDSWYDSYEGAPTDGSARIGPLNSQRVRRGGSYAAVSRYSESGFRSANNPEHFFDTLGFRVAADLYCR